MLSLQIAGQNAELSDDFSFTMNLKSPLFCDLGSYSYPWKIRNTPRTQAIFGFRHRVESTTDPFVVLPGQFCWNGLGLFRGTVKGRIFNREYFEGSMYEQQGDFNYDIKNLNLQQIDFGGHAFPSETEALVWLNQNALDKYYPDCPLTCPEITNLNYFEPPSTDPDMQAYNKLNEMGYLSLTSAGERKPIVPFLYFRYVLDRLVTGLGYRLDDEFFTCHPDFNRLVMYNSASCNSHLVIENYTIDHLLFNFHVPRIPLGDFLKALEDYWGLKFLANPVRRILRIVPLKSIVASTDYDDLSRGIISKSVELDDKIPGYKMEMTLDSDDSSFQTITENEDDIVKRFKGSVARVSDLPSFPFAEIGEIRYVEATGKYYLLLIDKTWAETLLTGALFTKTVFRQPEETLSTKISTIYRNPSANIPEVTNQLKSWKDISPRFFFVEKSPIFPRVMLSDNQTSVSLRSATSCKVS